MKRALLALMLAAPAAHAADCELPMGHGWPPATENHGVAVEGLLVAGAEPALQLTWLPVRGEESALMLLPPTDGRVWMLRHARATERVDHRESIAGGSRRVLRVQQVPEAVEVPVPASLANRLVDGWSRALQAGVAPDRAARFDEGDMLTLVVGGERFSGTEPRCGSGELVIEMAEALVDAAHEGDPDDLPKRWDKLWESLDELDEELDGAG